MSLTIEAAEPARVLLADLTRDPELQCRAKGTQRAIVAEYAELYKTGAPLPPVIVFRDAKGQQWLADGFHRCAAAEHAGLAELPAEVREGSRKDALLFAAGANSSHGLRRTNADKRRAVLLVLGNFPKLSDRKIGEACGVDHKTVAAARAATVAQLEGGEFPQSEGQAQPADTSNDADPIIARLTKALQRAAEAWPEAQRDKLREVLKSLDPS